jgi:hypothetical protein
MPETMRCDICGGTKIGDVELDQDGLWVCSDCLPRLGASPIGELEDANLSDEITALKGKNVGAICLTLNLPYEPPFQRIVDHAVEMHNNCMSTWSFETQWTDGTTVWRDEAGGGKVFVSGDDEVYIRKGLMD